MFDIQEYHELISIQETKEHLHKNPEATLIAGGTDLLIKLREGKMTDVHFAGISRIRELKNIYHTWVKLEEPWVDPRLELLLRLVVTSATE
jgi:CO/xanthine dehydrogenase FAD-binding subunit